MDEDKIKDFCVDTVSDSTTAIVCKHVAGEAETPVEGSSTQGVERVEARGGCNGDDIMVEVLGSDVFVDDVCSRGEAGRRGSVEDEAGLAGDVKSLCGGSIVSEFGLREIGVSGAQALNPRSQTGVEGSSGAVLMPKERAQVVAAEEAGVVVRDECVEGGTDQAAVDGGMDVGSANDDVTPGEDVVLVGEAGNVGSGTELGGSLAVVGSICEEPQVVHVEEVAVVSREKGLEQEKAEMGAERVGEVIGGGVDAIKNSNSEQLEHLDDKVRSSRMENGVGDSSVVAGSIGFETQVLKEDEAVMKNVEDLERQEVMEGDESGQKQADDRVIAANELKTEKIGIVDYEVWNPGIEAMVVCTTPMIEKSSLQTKVIEDKSPVMVSNEGIYPKVFASDCSNLEGVLALGKDKGSMVEISFGETKKAVARAKSLDEQSKVAAIGEVSGMGNRDTVGSKVQCNEIDAEAENPTCPIDKQQEKAEKVGEGSKNYDDVAANAVSSSIPNQAGVGGNNTITDDQNPLNTESDHHLKLEECLEKSSPHNPSLFKSNIGPDMEVDEQVIDAEPVCVHGEQEKVKERSAEVERVCVNTASHGNVCADSTSNQVGVVAEAAAIGDKVLSNSIDDRRPTCLGSDENSNIETKCGRMEGEAQAWDEKQTTVMDYESVPVSNSDALRPAERDKMLDSKECMERGVAYPSEMESNSGLESEVKSLVTKAECTEAKSLGHPICVVAGAEMETKEGNVLNRNVDTQATRRGEIAPVDTQDVLNSNIEVSGSVEFEKFPEKGMAGDLTQIDSEIVPQVGGEGQVMKAEHVGLLVRQDMEVEEDIIDTEQSKADKDKFIEQAALNHGSRVEVHQACYQLPSENEGEFTVSDLVWGKVKCHPWWPGQIFDPSDASEMGMKHYKKDCYLVAFFGDRSFAWHEASLVKPFRTHFSYGEKQTNSEAFQNAVDCALEEVSRRVEFGLACSCIPKDSYEKIRLQIFKNAGIRRESSIKEQVDESASPGSFGPDKLIEYVKALARFPSGVGNRLELVIAKAQLRAFYQLKGYDSLPEFLICGQLLESDTDALVSEDRTQSSEVYEHDNSLYKDDELTSSKQDTLKSRNRSSHKRKHNLKDDVFHKKKERRLSELMCGMMDSPDDDDWSEGKTTGALASSSLGKKRKSVDNHDDHVLQDGRRTISFAKVSSTTQPSFPKPSFKIGDCIRRVASQLTGSPAILKSNSERFQKLDAVDEVDSFFQDFEDALRGKMIDSTDYSSLEELLSQLQVTAQDPMTKHDFLNVVVSFFSDFRNSIASGKCSEREFLAMDKVGGKRKKSSHSIAVSPETFEFEDMSDTYWTDRVIQNGSEEQPSRRSRKREYQIVPVELETPPQVGRRPYSRKRYSDDNNVVAAEKPAGYVDENAPAEILMNFSEVNSVPSETNLNNMFKRFGPLKESETEVDREMSRARVVFKKSSDAEVAFSSAGRFNIFGPKLVNYQLSYTPSALFKASPMDTAQDHEMQLDLANLEVNLV